MTGATTAELTVILPTLNEEGNVGPITARIWKAVPTARIIFADDGSTDATQQRVLELQTSGKPVQLIARSGKPCLTDSIWDGIQATTTPYVAWMDADMSHPPEILPRLLESARGGGCAIATRFAPGGSRKKNTRDTPDSFLATALSGIMNVLVQQWLGLRLTDYTSGFIVCRRNLLADHRLVGDYGEYFIELMYYLSRQGVHITEVPYESPPRLWGESKTGATVTLLVRRGVKYLWLALRLRLPRQLFGRFSLAQPQRRTS